MSRPKGRPRPPSASVHLLARCRDTSRAQEYSNTPEDVDLYVCEVDADKVDHELNLAGSFMDLNSVLGFRDLDAVDFALPHHLHRPVAMQVADAGKHCMTEKPMALNLKEANEMLDAAAGAGTRLAVAENYQFMDDSTQARRLIDAGRIGEVYMVRVNELWRIGPRPGSWWFQRATAGGGSLISLGIHSVRTLRVLAGGTATRAFALFSDKVSPEISLEGEDTSTRMSQVAKELRCSNRLSLFST